MEHGSARNLCGHERGRRTAAVRQTERELTPGDVRRSLISAAPSFRRVELRIRDGGAAQSPVCGLPRVEYGFVQQSRLIGRQRGHLVSVKPVRALVDGLSRLSAAQRL